MILLSKCGVVQDILYRMEWYILEVAIKVQDNGLPCVSIYGATCVIIMLS